MRHGTRLGHCRPRGDSAAYQRALGHAGGAKLSYNRNPVGGRTRGRAVLGVSKGARVICAGVGVRMHL